MDTKNICVLGDGGWGTTLAILLANKGCSVTMWGAFPDYVEMMRSSRQNIKFLPGVKLPDSIKLTSDLEEALRNRQVVVLAVPSQHMRAILMMLKMEDLKGKIVVSVAKGIENTTLKTMAAVIGEVLGDVDMAVLSGPTIALEVVNGVPTTAVLAAKNAAIASELQELFMTERFRIYANDDVTGVELGGSLKNIIAIAAGILDALGYGTNAKAALLTRGIVEMARLGTAMGARRETFYGLSGLGDLSTTCTSQYSRNRWLGEEVGRGRKMKDVLKETDMVVEGAATARSAFDLAKKYKVDMPITAEVYRVLYENKDPRQAIRDLMTRPSKSESDM